VEYFKGKHKKYPHPVQFFFVVMFFFLLVFNKQIGDKGFSFNNLGNNFNFSFNPTEKEDKAEITSEMVLESLKYSAKKHSYLRAYNQLPADLKNKETERALDSVLSTVYKKENRNLVFVQHVTDSIALSNGDSINLSNDSVDMNLLTFKSKIALDDLFNQTPDEIIENYGVNGWMEQTLLKQILLPSKTLLCRALCFPDAPAFRRLFDAHPRIVVKFPFPFRPHLDCSSWLDRDIYVVSLVQLLSAKLVDDYAQMAHVCGNLCDWLWSFIYNQFAPGAFSILKENSAKAAFLRIFPFLGLGFEHDSQSNI
jgi:hypothetical protein